MEFKIFLVISQLILPTILIAFGLRFRKRAPEKINMLYGYRTTRSMKSRETWEFANHYMGELWVKLGVGIFVFSLLASLLSLKLNDDQMSYVGLGIMAVQLIVVFVSVYFVEKALKEKFNEDGVPKK